jgi:hypothetical protein
VEPFPPTGARYQVSPAQGGDPLWTPDGKQLIYLETLNEDHRMVAVDVRTQPSFAVGTPERLPIAGMAQARGRPYDVTPDGKQFVMMFPASETKDSDTLQINVVLNWFQDLKQRAPAK